VGLCIGVDVPVCCVRVHVSAVRLWCMCTLSGMWRGMCMYAYVYVSVFVYIVYVYVCVCVSVYAFEDVRMCGCVNVYVCERVRICGGGVYVWEEEKHGMCVSAYCERESPRSVCVV